MKVQTAKQILKIKEWTAQIDACNQSNKSVRQWCRENNVALKTYYYHLKRVREEMLESIESSKTLTTLSAELNSSPVDNQANHYSNNRLCLQEETPMFAMLPISQSSKSAVMTVQIGRCAVDIQNGADNSMVEQVLRVVASL